MSRSGLDLGYRIAAARKMLGLSVTRLAELSEVSTSAITNYEHGLSQPRADLLSKLAETMGVSLNWLVYGNHPPKADRELMKRLVLYEKKLEG